MSKYIIELDDDIAKATPYNPTGDLISRSDLKTQLEVYRHTRNYKSDEDEAQNALLDNVLEDIDNAQAISLPNEQIISDIPKDYLYDTETEEFYVYRNKYTGKEIHIVKNPPAYILDKRPQGEQIAWEQGYEAGLAQGKHETKGVWTTDENGYFYCDRCGRYPHDQYATTDFCPKCEAFEEGDTE